MKRMSLSVEALSDGKGEFGEDHREPAAGLGIEAEFVVSATQVLDDRNARYRPRPPTTLHRGEPLICLSSGAGTTRRPRWTTSWCAVLWTRIW